MLTGFLSRVAALLAAVVLTTASARSADAIKASPEKEKAALAILTSDSPAAEKALACKKLAVDGSAAAVPELAKLLPNEQLSSWARIALEAIPGPEADEALRKATETLEGRLLVGTINSIGVRRDAKAVDMLAKRIQDKDAEVASAAAVALGHIGTADAAKSLRGALAIAPANVRSAVAEGCILCAERLHAAGKSAEAAEIYDQVRKADVPKPRVLEATRGVILARQAEGVPILLEQLRSSDKALFQLALTVAREVKGNELDQALAEELTRAAPERAVLYIQAMADRPDTIVVAAVSKAAGEGPKPVRVAAIGALARVGDSSSLAPLLETAVGADAELAAAAKAALADLPGDKVNAQIAALLAKAEGKSLPVLIELVGQRRIDATPPLLKALESSDKAVRAAALTALGETIGQKQLAALIKQAVSPKHADDAPIARKALQAAAVRMPDREACAAELATALESTSSIPTKVLLLDIVGAVGGKKALATVGSAAAKSNDDGLQDAGTRLLGGWSTDDAGPVLLALAQGGTGDKYQVRALRGYIRIARQFVLPDDRRADMTQKAFAAASQPAEKKLVLEVLQRYPTPETLKQSISAMQVAELKHEATAAALVIAQKLGAKGVDVKTQLAEAGFEKVKLEIVKAEYGAGDQKKDVTATVRKQAGDLPLIALPAAYNSAFGGDPASGKPKQLKIQYRINGKQAEATFAEDALIILPMPK